MGELPHQRSPERQHLRSGPLSLVYWRWQGPANCPALLLHGGLDHARAWDGVCAALSADRPVLALDLRGHGDSDWSPEGAYDPPFYVADILALLQHVGPCHIVAHSMGANLTLRLAASMPELMRKLVLVEGVLGEGLFRAEQANVDPRMQAWVDEMKAMSAASAPVRQRMWLEQRAALADFPTRRYVDLAEAIDRLLSDQDKRLTPAQARHLAETGLKQADGGLIWKFDPQVRGRFALDFTPEQMAEIWRAVRAPMLHVYGSKSWAYPLEPAQQAHFPDAQFAIIEGAGHWVHLNKPEQFIARVRGFLREGIDEGL